MKSFGLWLLSVTMLGLALGCGEAKKETPPAAAPPVADPAAPGDAPADPAP
jgi:hypothetical protein